MATEIRCVLHCVAKLLQPSEVYLVAGVLKFTFEVRRRVVVVFSEFLSISEDTLL